MRVGISDRYFPDFELERRAFGRIGIEVDTLSCLTSDDLAQVAHNYDALLVGACAVGPAVFQNAPRLNIVSRYGASVTQIDLREASSRGVWVTNSPDYWIEEAATHAIACILSGLRRLHRLDRDVRAGVWDCRSAGNIHRISNLTLGVVGLGKVGTLVAARLAPFFSQVLFHDPHVTVPHEGMIARRTCLNEILSTADAVCFSAPFNKQTEGCINSESDSATQKQLVFVNLADMRVFDPIYLRKSLEQNRFTLLAIDVPEPQPLRSDHWLLDYPAVLLTPHCAHYSEESEDELRSNAIDNIVRWHLGTEPRHVIVRGRPKAQGSQP